MKMGVLISKSCPKNRFNSWNEFLLRGGQPGAAGGAFSVQSLRFELGIFGVIGVGMEIQKTRFNLVCKLGFGRSGECGSQDIESAEEYLGSCLKLGKSKVVLRMSGLYFPELFTS